MKSTFKYLKILLFILPSVILAQNKLTGIVTDKANGQNMPGVNVVVKGTTNGVSTDFSGAYSISNIKNGDVVVFTFMGFNTVYITYTGQNTQNVAIQEESNKLNEVVVVGYGSIKKKDATGSVDLITSKEFNKGAIFSVDQLLTGKAAGVRITNNGGDPDSAPNIRIRGGGSISASNDPLIVVDGVALSNENAAGNNNSLSLINPSDIESFSILKDASATAIYGARASNGVILITTKKGTAGKTEYNFTSSVSIGEVQNKIRAKGAAEFTNFVVNNLPQYTNLLGIDDPTNTLTDNPNTAQIEGRILSDTDWQDAIYQNSVSSDNNLSVRTNLFKKIPFRASFGYTKNEGLVKTSELERFTPSIRLTPSLFEKHLKIDINAKGLFSSKNAIDEGGVFGNALSFDPTKPIFNNLPNKFGGYYQGINLPGAPLNPGELNGGQNPLAILEQRSRPEEIRKVVGNLELDYKLHFFPNLRAVLNLGLEASRSRIKEVFTENAIQTYQNVGAGVFNPGVNYLENQTITNTLMDAYLVYNKELTGLIKKVDLQGGYNYQNFVTDGNKQIFTYDPVKLPNGTLAPRTGLRRADLNPENLNNRYINDLNLQSFFARSNVDIAGKYLFTFSARADASSLFIKNKRWGYFPATAFAWKISEENFLKESKVISNLKLRLGWGKTGQQDVARIDGIGYYPSKAFFSIGNQNSQYLPGFTTYSAKPFNPDITWEKTTTYNTGLDFELFKKQNLSGSIDIYQRETKDLVAKVNVPPGQGLTNEFVSNTGSTKGKGIEANVTVKLIERKDYNIDFNANGAYNFTRVTSLNGLTSVDAQESGIPDGTGTKIGRHTLNYQPYSFLVFEQIYGQNGKPIENAYVDRNRDGQITDADKYLKAVRPNWTFGYGLNASYRNFDFTTSFRGQYGGLIYNTKQLIAGNRERVAPGQVSALNNVLSGELLFNDKIGKVPLTDFLLEDASFIRCENITIGYKFNTAIKNGSLRLYLAANNVFVLSKYNGQDPENFNGIDNNFYPRPRLYTFGLNLNF